MVVYPYYALQLISWRLTHFTFGHFLPHNNLPQGYIPTIRPKIKGGKGIRGRQIECDGMNGFSLWSIFFLSLGA